MIKVRFFDIRNKRYVTHEDIGFGCDLAVNGNSDVYLIDYPETIELGYIEAHYYKGEVRVDE